MGEKLVTVVMPVYNARKYVETAVRSVLRQDYPDFELLLIDDGATDGSWEIAESIGDGRIRRIRNMKNLGVSRSRNRGIEESEGEYVIFMDHDDIMPQGRIRKHVAYLQEHGGMIAVGGKIANIDGEDNFIGYFMEDVPKDPRYIRARLLTLGVFINGAVTYRKSAFAEHGIRFRSDAYGLEDYILMMEASKAGDISATDDIALWYRRHGANTENLIFENFLAERQEKWKETYKYSFGKEGIAIGAGDAEVLLTGFAERRGRPLTNEEYGKLLLVFADIEDQAWKLDLEIKNGIKDWFWECRLMLC